MKLLIVDDQKTVVDGLLKNIDWEKIGISSVIGAYSSSEARNILTEQVVDVMLCDIEMPRENGLSLFKWIREQNIHTRCIFLTAHAEFTYAQKSITLGAFDYILQPAPYTVIRTAVEKAVQEIRNELDKNLQNEFVKVSEWQKQNVIAKTFKKYLQGIDNVNEIEQFTKKKWYFSGFLSDTPCFAADSALVLDGNISRGCAFYKY